MSQKLGDTIEGFGPGSSLPLSSQQIVGERRVTRPKHAEESPDDGDGTGYADAEAELPLHKLMR